MSARERDRGNLANPSRNLQGGPMTRSRTMLTALAMAFCTFLGGCHKEKEAAPLRAGGAPRSEGTIVAVGDSLTEGLGLSQTEAYPAQLEKKLNESGYHWQVVNAGISGETTTGTLSRIDWIMKLKPDIVILEIGANDGLRGIPTSLIRENIDKMVSEFQSRGIVVVLAGMQMLRNMGPVYVRDFAALYPEIADKHHLILEPFFLAKVAGETSLNQPDGIHPLAGGYRIVADTLYPYVLQAIDQNRGSKLK
jgi:acyl-CoA thioesterase I